MTQGAPVAATVEEPARKVSSRRVIKRKGSGFTPSIKDALAGKFQEENQEENAIDKMKYYSGEQLSEPFTAEVFAQKWEEYLQRLSDRPVLKASLSRTPQIFDSCKLKLQIDSDIVDTEISKIKPDLVSWLRKELRNTGIELITEISELDDTRARPYSETEKFAEMLRKNPQISLLKQTFNLDFSDH
ncbi:hypothetical protein [Mangrovibacterium marinum]|uniref:DNA polymerase-3 subunit gamma/tau n=1 Tax=Mangrovibacterium marinum TaxID=1639118 RepID=A0A2T5C350_9BACT|nr:hypothetical protein [Mangrovibacterium marinum]PTN09164.1 hypothetical protein C8N47_1054 [Mangrovibacterium marinum]